MSVSSLARRDYLPPVLAAACWGFGTVISKRAVAEIPQTVQSFTPESSRGQAVRSIRLQCYACGTMSPCGSAVGLASPLAAARDPCKVFVAVVCSAGSSTKDYGPAR